MCCGWEALPVARAWEEDDETKAVGRILSMFRILKATTFASDSSTA